MVDVAGWDYRHKEAILESAQGPEVQNPTGSSGTGANESDHVFGNHSRVVATPGLDGSAYGSVLADAW